MEQYNPKNPDLYKQVELPPPPLPALNIVPLAQSMSTLKEGDFQSKNFRSGRAGFRLRSDGTGEFQDGIFGGTFNIGGTSITIDNTQDIQTNLDLIESEGGGTLFLQPGTYTLTADISVPSRVTLQGVSRDGVILDCNSSYKVKMSGSNPYTTGTIALNNGDTTVVGTGTTFTSGMVGQFIFLADYWYEITVFTDTTHITIGDAYFGENLSGYGYAIADPCFNAVARRLTIINATGIGLEVAYSSEPWLDDLYIYSNGTGIDMDYVYAPLFFVSSFSNGVNGNLNYTSAFEIRFSAFAQSTSGAGLVLTNCTSSTIFDSDFSGNTADGINSTSSSNIAIVSFSANANGGQGIEYVSGCNNNQISHGEIADNTSDGAKLTATSDNNTILACSIHDNGGYGINIAASTCDNNQIIAPAFSNNTSGTISDSGTNTFVSPQEVGATTEVFLTSDTWTKPASGTMAYIQVWGAGGSGGRCAAGRGGGGGGGGGYYETFIPLASLGATETVTVGTGGAAQTTQANGAVGGNSSFGSWVTAYGGGGGYGATTVENGGGGGGGTTAVGSVGQTGAGGAGGADLVSLAGGVGAVAATSAATSTLYGGGGGGHANGPYVGAKGFWGGGGGGGGSAGTGTAGGASVHGGGGGGAGGDSAGGAGGASTFGGNGGAGNFNASNATAGSVPGGGGGGSETGNSGAGGNGKVQVTVF